MKYSYSTHILTLLFAIATFTACKQDNTSVMTADEGDTMVSDITGETFQLDPLPNACDIVTSDQMAEILGLEEGELEMLDGNRNNKGANNTSCFYKWYDDSYDNSGVMIQIIRNSMPDELPDYVQATMNNKKWNGENSFEEPGVKYMYVDYEGIEVPAIFNDELDRYYFTKGYKYLYSVAFNYPIETTEMHQMFDKISALMLNNF